MIHIPFNTDKSPTLERDMGGSYKGNKRFALHAHEHLIGNWIDTNEKNSYDIIWSKIIIIVGVYNGKKMEWKYI